MCSRFILPASFSLHFTAQGLWESDQHCKTAVGVVGNPELAVMPLDYPLDDSQAQTGAVGLAARRIQPGKRPQQAGQVCFGNALAMIPEAEHDALLFFLVLVAGAYIEMGDRRIRRLAVAPGIFDNIGKQPVQFDGISLHLHIRMDRRADDDIALPGVFLDDLFQHVAQADKLEIEFFRRFCIE
jgi:hypothetical protein